MPRVTITLPNNLHEKLLKYACDNDDSLSYTITKMTEIGLMVTEASNKIKAQKTNFQRLKSIVSN